MMELLGYLFLGVYVLVGVVLWGLAVGMVLEEEPGSRWGWRRVAVTALVLVQTVIGWPLMVLIHWGRQLQRHIDES